MEGYWLQGQKLEPDKRLTLCYLDLCTTKVVNKDSKRLGFVSQIGKSHNEVSLIFQQQLCKKRETRLVVENDPQVHNRSAAWCQCLISRCEQNRRELRAVIRYFGSSRSEGDPHGRRGGVTKSCSWESPLYAFNPGGQGHDLSQHISCAHVNLTMVRRDNR